MQGNTGTSSAPPRPRLDLMAADDGGGGGAASTESSSEEELSNTCENVTVRMEEEIRNRNQTGRGEELRWSNCKGGG